jgi:hypothetical protein
MKLGRRRGAVYLTEKQKNQTKTDFCKRLYSLADWLTSAESAAVWLLWDLT